MAGIAGVVYTGSSLINQLIFPMMTALHHRGSTSDVYTFQNIQLGICGQFFASNAEKNVQVALDGFIDNNLELRRELIKLGYRFETDQQSELIVYAYKHWKSSFLEHINGSFAFALLDTEQEILLLARDRIGKKPLYWYQDQHYFLFASELKSIMATGAVPQTPAEEALASYLYFGYIPQDMSPVKDVNKLLPSYYLQYSYTNSRKQIQSYWSFSSFFQPKASESKSTIFTHMNYLLCKSVRHLLPKNEPIGCFLSGGVGSTCVAHYLRNESNNPLFAFTAEFQGENDENVQVAKEIAADLKLLYRSETISSQIILEDLVKMIWYLDEPLADPNIMTTWQLSKLASENTRLVFSGMGSDELFSSQSHAINQRGEADFLISHLQMIKPFLAQLLLPFAKCLHKPSAYTLLKRSRTNPWQFDYLRKNALFDEHQLTELSPKLSSLFDPEVFLHKFHHLPKIKSRLSSLFYLDVKTRLPDLYVVQFERLTSAHQLHWHTPFLDRYVIEYLAGISELENVSSLESGEFLKELLKGVLSPDLINQPKKTRKEFLKSHVIASQLREIFPLLLNGTLIENGLISKNWLKTKLKLLNTKNEGFTQLWGILVLEIWFRIYINRAISSKPPIVTTIHLLQGNEYV
jgi:asparagine synthase (glutamine-hydrolysing)